MASVAAPVAIASGPDELDRLLDYDNAVEDFLRDVPVGNGTDHEQSANMPKEIRDEDQEIQVRKKRAPVPKLDEDRWELNIQDNYRTDSNLFCAGFCPQQAYRSFERSPGPGSSFMARVMSFRISHTC